MLSAGPQRCDSYLELRQGLRGWDMFRIFLIGLAMLSLASCVRTVEPSAEERLEMDARREIEKMD